MGLPVRALVGVVVVVASVSGMAQQDGTGSARTGERGVMLMNRIGPSSSELHVAKSDGTGEPRTKKAS